MEDGVKISELTQLSSLNGEGIVPIVSNNETKQINIVDLVYPVGAIYMSMNSTNPSAIFGGTWEQIKGRYLLGAGAPSQNTNTNMGSLTQQQLTWNFTAGETLGEYTHTLTINELPSHNHQGLTWYGDNTQPITLNTGSYTGFALPYSSGTNQDSKNAIHTNSTGGGLAHNNMSACLVVYMWKRTA